MPDLKMGDELSADEIMRVRARIHKLADKVQGHEIFIETQRESSERNKQDIASMRMEFFQQIASARFDAVSQLATLRADCATKTELGAFTALATEKMSTLQKSIDKANETLAKVAWIVITAVIVALIGLVIVNRGALGKVARALKPAVDLLAQGPIVGGGR